MSDKIFERLTDAAGVYFDFDHHVARLERLRQRPVDRFGLAGVVRGEIADVDIERRAVAFGPGVDGKV